MIKRILKIWFIIGMYELSKYLTNELIVKLQSEDDVDAPSDYARESASDRFEWCKTMTCWIVLVPIAYLVWIIVKSKMEE